MLFSNVMQGGCILSGIDFHGGDIGVAVVKDTKEMCQKHCQDTSGCLYFTWVDDTHPSSWNHKRCFLKNTLIESKAGEGLYSGPKFCQGNFKSLSMFYYFIVRALIYTKYFP